MCVDLRFPDGPDDRETRGGEERGRTHCPTCTRLRITAALPRGRTKGKTSLARHARERGRELEGGGGARKGRHAWPGMIQPLNRKCSPVAFPSETVAKVHL